VLPLERAESFTFIVLNGIARLLVTVRFLTTDEACAGVLGAGVLGATEGVADAVAGTIAARVAVAAGVASDPQALITSRLLTANVILMAGLMASSPILQRHFTSRTFGQPGLAVRRFRFGDLNHLQKAGEHTDLRF
jgi:hypothetical protein